MKDKVLLISPFSGLWLHALPEAFIINHLNGDYELIRVTCNGTFSTHCTVMESLDIPIKSNDEIKLQVCKDCKNCSDLLNISFKYNTVFFSDFLENLDYQVVDKIISEGSLNDLINYRIEGLDIGKISLYEVLIKFKLTHCNFNQDQLLHYILYFRNTFLSFLSIKKIFQLHKPDHVFAYSPQYSISGVCLEYAQILGAKTYFMEGSSNIYDRYKSLRIWDWTKYGLTNPALTFWSQKINYHKIPIKYINVAIKHLESLKKAKSFSVYSEPESGTFDLFDYFKIPRDHKVLLASMSSYDEVYSAFMINKFPENKFISNVYEDQLAWIADTIKFISNHKKTTLIVRLHPRTFASDRNKVEAEENIKIKSIFYSLPDNVRVNWPEEKVSLYDILPSIDALITGWSATSIEAMYYGIPVVTYDKNLPSFPSSIHLTGSTKKEYYFNIEKAVKMGRNEVHKKNAIEWWAFNALGTFDHPLFIQELLEKHFGKAGYFVFMALKKLLKQRIKLIDLYLFKRSLKSKNDIIDLVKFSYSSIYQFKINNSHLK